MRLRCHSALAPAFLFLRVFLLFFLFNSAGWAFLHHTPISTPPTPPPTLHLAKKKRLFGDGLAACAAGE